MIQSLICPKCIFTVAPTKFSLRIVPLLFVILSSNLAVLAKGKFMIVHPCRVEVNDSLCYLVKKGQGWTNIMKRPHAIARS